MEIVIYFAIGIILGAGITTISHRMGSKTYEKAVHFIMSPQVPEGENISSSKDFAEEDYLYNFQAPEDALNMYDGVQVDQPTDEENREPDNNQFKELD